MIELMASDDSQSGDPTRARSRAAEIHDFARSELFERTFREGMELVEDTASYLDGDGRRESKLLSRAAALAYAAESMKLTTRLMQVASWLLVQRAVREGDMEPEAACDARYRLTARPLESEPSHAELPIALIEYVVRAEKLHDRVLYLDRRMYLTPPPRRRRIRSSASWACWKRPSAPKACPRLKAPWCARAIRANLDSWSNLPAARPVPRPAAFPTRKPCCAFCARRVKPTNPIWPAPSA